MLVDVQALQLLNGRGPQTHRVLDHRKDDHHSHRYPGNDADHAQALGEEELGTAAVEQATVHRQQAGEQGTHSAAHTVDRNGAHRIVNLGYLIKEFHRQGKHDAGTDTDDGRTLHRYHVTAGGDGHQSAQRCVEGHGDIRLLEANPSKEHGGHAGHSSRHIGGDEDAAGSHQGVVPGHGHGRAAVESKPAEPQHKHAQRGDGEVVAQNGPGLAVPVILADAGPQDLGADEGGHAAHHMHRGGTGKVMEAQLGQPAAAPDPVAGDGIDHSGNQQRIDAVGNKLGALCHSARYDGSGGGAKHRLENEEGEEGNPLRQDGGIVAPYEGIKAAYQRPRASEHQAEAQQPEDGRADAEVHQVLHQNIARVFCPGKSRLTHGKAGLHEKDQRGAQQHPDRVH